jgi:hypothetical protein
LRDSTLAGNDSIFALFAEGRELSDREEDIIKRLQDKADNLSPAQVDFGQGYGPFVLPKCGPQISAQVGPGDVFVLSLETEERGQRVDIPVSVKALASLRGLIQVLSDQYGLDQTRN